MKIKRVFDLLLVIFFARCIARRKIRIIPKGHLAMYPEFYPRWKVMGYKHHR